MIRRLRQGNTIEHRFKRGEPPPRFAATPDQAHHIFVTAIYGLGNPSIKCDFIGDHPHIEAWRNWWAIALTEWDAHTGAEYERSKPRPKIVPPK